MSTATVLHMPQKVKEKPRQGKRTRGVYEYPEGSGRWWVRFVDAAGKYRRERVPSKASAIRLYHKRKTEAMQGRKLPELLRQRPATFAEIAQAARDDMEHRHRCSRDGLTQLNRAVEWFGSSEAASLSPAQLEAKLSAVAASEGWAASTVNHHLNQISLVFKLALRAGTVTANPARQVQRRSETNVRQGFITGPQYAALSRACGSLWLRTMLALGYTYGWRAGELVGLRCAQVDLLAGTVRLEPGTTKNREGRMIRLTTECLELVKACVAGKAPDGSLLTYENGLPVCAYRYGWEQLCVRVGLGRFICRTCHAPGTATAATGRACSACAKAKRRGVFGYEGLLFHDLRRSAVRNLERASVPRSVAMKITGHKTESVYRRYAIVSEADLAEAVARLERNQPSLESAPATARDSRVSAKVQ